MFLLPSTHPFTLRLSFSSSLSPAPLDFVLFSLFLVFHALSISLSLPNPTRSPSLIVRCCTTPWFPLWLLFYILVLLVSSFSLSICFFLLLYRARQSFFFKFRSFHIAPRWCFFSSLIFSRPFSAALSKNLVLSGTLLIQRKLLCWIISLSLIHPSFSLSSLLLLFSSYIRAFIFPFLIGLFSFFNPNSPRCTDERIQRVRMRGRLVYIHASRLESQTEGSCPAVICTPPTFPPLLDFSSLEIDTRFSAIFHRGGSLSFSRLLLCTFECIHGRF